MNGLTHIEECIFDILPNPHVRLRGLVVTCKDYPTSDRLPPISNKRSLSWCPLSWLGRSCLGLRLGFRLCRFLGRRGWEGLDPKKPKTRLKSRGYMRGWFCHIFGPSTFWGSVWRVIWYHLKAKYIYIYIYTQRIHVWNIYLHWPLK